MKKLTIERFIAASIRAIKTVVQTALGMFTVGLAINEVNWQQVISVALVAGIYSVLTSLAGLPEVGTDGTLFVDTSNSDKDIYRLDLTDGIDSLSKKSAVKFTVDRNAKLSQK